MVCMLTACFFRTCDSDGAGDEEAGAEPVVSGEHLTWCAHSSHTVHIFRRESGLLADKSQRHTKAFYPCCLKGIEHRLRW